MNPRFPLILSIGGTTMRKLLAVGVTALFLTPVLAGNAVADNNGKSDYTTLAEVTVTADQFNRLGNGTVIDWSGGRTQIRFNVDPDEKAGTDLDVATGEWEVQGFAEACGQRRGQPVFHEHFVNTNTYGPRVLVFPTSPEGGMVARLGSIELVHEGPSAHDHFDTMGGPGRHLMACVDV